MGGTQGAIAEVSQHRGAFALGFVAIFAITFGFLAAVGATPDPVRSDASDEVSVYTTPVESVPDNPEEPVRVVARDINLEATIANPTSADIAVLDEALLRGAVRYPTSAMMGESGTVLLFGHSSYLPVVHNQAYKTFDGIQDLAVGDIVSVYSDSTEYRYSVTGVKVADATTDSIELPREGKHLVLVTCNTFASKEKRFIVRADFVGAYAPASN